MEVAPTAHHCVGTHRLPRHLRLLPLAEARRFRELLCRAVVRVRALRASRHVRFVRVHLHMYIHLLLLDSFHLTCLKLRNMKS